MAKTPFDATSFDDGFAEEPPAPEPKSTLHDPHPHRRAVGRFEAFLRQLGHRLSLIAFLALCGAVVATLFRANAYWALLLVAFVVSDAGLLCGLICSWLQRRRNIRDREPAGLILFNLVVLIPTMILIVMAKTENLSPLITKVMGES